MIDVGPRELRVRHGGSGPPLLLLHGHPRTHMTWGAGRRSGIVPNEAITCI
jgi:haloacetate dehalogenase